MAKSNVAFPFLHVTDSWYLVVNLTEGVLDLVRCCLAVWKSYGHTSVKIHFNYLFLVRLRWLVHSVF